MPPRPSAWLLPIEGDGLEGRLARAAIGEVKGLFPIRECYVRRVLLPHIGIGDRESGEHRAVPRGLHFKMSVGITPRRKADAPYAMAVEVLKADGCAVFNIPDIAGFGVAVAAVLHHAGQAGRAGHAVFLGGEQVAGNVGGVFAVALQRASV